ncbi:MAG TPA: hypothetical protein VH227_06745 [Candidatus Udaeobacter sp.]|nr:hypothetical protein [Candidatus Udaeobacter sp.]
MKTQYHSAPTVTPQALAWDGNHLWVSSRDFGTLYKIDIGRWTIVEEIDPPGTVWAGVSSSNGNMYFTIGKGLNDDRYIYRYSLEEGFTKIFACPDFTGSFLSFDGKHLYMSQWYKERILKFDGRGNILRNIDVGAEICGHTFANDRMFVLRGRENKDHPTKSEEWHIARLDPEKETPHVEDITAVPFAARSLTFDGELFWSNYRAKDAIISFAVPA